MTSLAKERLAIVVIVMLLLRSGWPGPAAMSGAAWSYLYHTTDVEPERMVDLLTRILPSMSKEKLMTTAERLRQKGSADMLLHFLARRFGPLRPEVEERIRAASIPELERWADAVLSAHTLDEVMGAGRDP